MSTYYSLLTTTGEAANTQSYATRQPVNLVHLAVGDGNGAFVMPTESMTALINERCRVPISSLVADTQNPNWLIVEAAVPASVGGFTVREVGIFDDLNRLIAVGNFPETYKPMLTQGSARDLLIRFIVQNSNAAQVTLAIDTSVVYATSTSVANAVAAHEAKADPHPQYVTHVELEARLRADRAKRYYRATHH